MRIKAGDFGLVGGAIQHGPPSVIDGGFPTMLGSGARSVSVTYFGQGVLRQYLLPEHAPRTRTHPKKSGRLSRPFFVSGVQTRITFSTAQAKQGTGRAQPMAKPTCARNPLPVIVQDCDPTSCFNCTERHHQSPRSLCLLLECMVFASGLVA